MKTRLYWFSGTGNSLWLARSLQAGLEGAELVPVARALEQDHPVVGRVGVVFPVYYFGPPVMVAEFLKRMPAEAGTYIFIAVTCGGHPGAVASIVQRLLGERGLELAAAHALVMPDNYPRVGGAPSPEKQRRMLAAALPAVTPILDDVRNLRRGRIGKPFFLADRLGRFAWRIFSPRFARWDRKFTADDKCTGCGVCEKVCPAEDITLVDGRPVWRGRCQQCYACFHWCPVEAIQHGRTQRQIRYHHPDCRLSDMTLRA